MADIRFETFDTNQGDWESYSERFGFFLQAHGVIDLTKQKAIFFASCGNDLYQLVKTLIFPQKLDQVTLDVIVEKLNNHFRPRPNEIVESYKFHMRNQAKDESMQDYIAALRKMTRYCNFLDLERTLRDRLVCGVIDVKLQERFLSKANLEYSTAVEMALQAEKRDEDLKLIKITSSVVFTPEASSSRGGEVEPMDINAVGDNRRKQLLCYRCGGSHTYHNCKFAKSKCNACDKIGHIAKMCRTKKIHGKVQEIQEEQFLNGLYSMQEGYREPPVCTKLQLNKKMVNFEVDSGCSYSIMSIEQAQSIWPNGLPKMEKTELNLQTWTHNKVQLHGSIQVFIKYKNFTGYLPLLIGQGKGNLLGRNWFKPLGISVEGINSVEDDRTDMKSLMDLMNRYEEVFKEGLGEYKGPDVVIKCKPEVQPKFMQSRPVPFAIRDKVCEEIDRLAKTGVLEPVPYSQWATPVVPVSKPDGSIRLCGDYRLTVNLATETDTYPQPTINESLSEVAGGRVFTKLDLKQAYTQLKVSNETADLLTINTQKGLYRMKRLPYGLKACPGIFQRIMSTTLAGIRGVTVLLDDILISGKNAEEHNCRLEKVLACLKKIGLRLNKKKCKLGTDKVEFLGYVVDEKGIHPSNKKVLMIANAKKPRNVKEVQAFLGLLNFYERFIKDKATLLEPLHRLLDKNAKWKWGSAEEEAFLKAKKMLSSEQTLVHFDNNRDVTLTCDASEYGVGAVLAHIMDDGSEKPIALGSRTLSKAERNYAQIDKEAAAIMFGLDKFNQYVYGRHVKIYTDHKPLLGILSPNKAIPKVLSPRMMRWALKINSHDYELIHKSGTSIGNADALSRWPLESEDEQPMTDDRADILLLSETPSAVQYSAKDIAEKTNQDEALAKVKYWILHGWPDRVDEANLKMYWLKRNELSISNDCIIWGSRVVIPPPMREYMLTALHETHDGIVISKSIARSYFWWPGLDHEIEALVASCDSCQVNRNMPASTSHSWITPSNPWERLHIDFAGPFQQKTYLIVIDPYSKWPEVKLVSSTSSECAIKALREIFATQGLPETVVSDNGTGFTSEQFKEFMKCNGIRHILTPPYSPASNGQAERTVQTVKNKLRSLSGTDIDVKLPRLLFGLRTAPSTVTGKSPAEMLNKRRFRTRFEIIHPFSVKPVAERQIESNREVPVRAFRVKDKVWLRNYARGEKWVKGEIFRVKGPVRFFVKMENGPIVTRHVNQLRRRDDGETSGPSGEMRDLLGIPHEAIVTCEGDRLRTE